MKRSTPRSPACESKPVWQKTQFANLIRYVPSGVYYARFRVRGKLVWKSLKTDTVTIAKLRLADLEKGERANAEKKQNSERGRMSFGDVLKLTLDRAKAKPKLKPRTLQYYDQRAAALTRSWPEIESKDIRSITRDQCLAWAGRFGAKISPVAYNHTVSILRRTFEMAIERGVRYDNPAAAIEWVKEHPKELQLPEPAQFEALLKEVESCGWVYGRESANMIRFLAFGGFRKTEARHVLWRHCDFAGGMISVYGHPETGTKNSSPRKVPMIPDMRRLLDQIRASRSAVTPDDPVLAFHDCRKALAHACKKIGIPRLTHHDLRHLFATRCIESGVDIPTVSRWLGHKDGGALAMRVYGHLRDAHSAEMAKRVVFSSSEAAEESEPKAPPVASSVTRIGVAG